MRFFILSLLCFYSLAGYADFSKLPAKASTDQSEYRHLVLDNGLPVILLSDPDLNKSSAGIAVGAGAYSDPEGREGLAHFLEHMLFLGTAKFPDESEYGSYLQSNGGYANAYTSGDHTNYFFEINHGAVEGALDRFSQFFISPLFSEEFTEREMNAVDSEFEKNLQHDGWRQQEMFRTLVQKDHPENHFSIGNHSTLDGIQRDEFIAFYDRYYSANLMALSITSNASLDQLETWARTYFSAIENRQREPVNFTADLVDQSRAPGVALMEPVKDLRSLSMVFPVSGTRSLYANKPAELIGFLLGYEGAGSLLSYLKEEGLATSLSGGDYDATKDYSLFEIKIGLTPKGTKEWQRVMAASFSFLRLLSESDYPEYLFQERATMARLDELYANKGEGAGRAAGLARQALAFPLEDAHRIKYIWKASAPEHYFGILKALRPNNMISTLEAKGVETNLTEKHFGVQYSLQAFDKDTLAALDNPTKLDGISLPSQNKFIPNSVELIAQRPVKLIDEPGLVLYYGQDTDFERPRVSYQMRIQQPKTLSDLESTILRGFYVDVVNEAINELAYTAGTAGLAASLTNSAKGVVISVSGYSQSASTFLDYVTGEMLNFELADDRFEALKERKVRQLENATFSAAWEQGRETTRKLLYETYYTQAEQLAFSKTVTYKQVQRFANKLFRKGNLEMIAFGNVSQSEAEAAARQVSGNFNMSPVKAKDLFETRLLELTAGEPVMTTDTLEVNNSAFRQEFNIGTATPKNRAAAAVIANFMSEPYYSEMRTRQQLGYLVWSYTFANENTMIGGFIIQSADYSADELLDRSTTFLSSLPGLFDALADDKFEVIRAGVRAELEQKDKSIAERGARFFGLAFDEDEHWSQADDTVEALEKLTREDIAAMLNSMTDPATSKYYAVLSFAKQHAEKRAGVKASFDDINVWKRNQSYQ